VSDQSPASSGGVTETSAIAAELSTTAQQAFLWHIHDYLGEYARFADTKAAFAGTVAGALIGCLYGAGLFAALIKTPICSWRLATWLAVIAGLFLSLSILLAGRVVYPRLRTSAKPGFIFWGGIAAFGSCEAWMTAFRQKSEKDLNEILQGQVFDVAKYVLIRKYDNVRYCLRMLLIGAALAGLALIAKP
jgi:hypothetical protein